MKWRINLIAITLLSLFIFYVYRLKCINEINEKMVILNDIGNLNNYKNLENYKNINGEYPVFIEQIDLSYLDEKENKEYFKKVPWSNPFFDPFINNKLIYRPIKYSNFFMNEDFIIYSVGMDGEDENKENIDNFNSKVTGDTLYFKGLRKNDKLNFCSKSTFDVLVRPPLALLETNKNIIIVYY